MPYGRTLYLFISVLTRRSGEWPQTPWRSSVRWRARTPAPPPASETCSRGWVSRQRLLAPPPTVRALDILSVRHSLGKVLTVPASRQPSPALNSRRPLSHLFTDGDGGSQQAAASAGSSSSLTSDEELRQARRRRRLEAHERLSFWVANLCHSVSPAMDSDDRCSAASQ